jgi:hypothetical protein
MCMDGISFRHMCDYVFREEVTSKRRHMVYGLGLNLRSWIVREKSQHGLTACNYPKPYTQL